MLKSKFQNTGACMPSLGKSPGRIVKLLAALGILLVIPGLAIGCNANSTPSPQSVLRFPAQKEVAGQAMAALLSGKLVIKNGYLRVNDNLILWPYGYSPKLENNQIFVLNDKAQPVAQVGDSVRVGGGVISASFAEEKIGQKLPDGIDGPFWLMGDIVTSK